MANYVFLMQLNNDTMLTDEDSGRLRAISEIGSGFSMIGCVMSLSLLCFLPVHGDGLFIAGNMSILLLGAQLSFIGAENTSYPDPLMCKIATSLIHYLFLGVHFCSLSYAVHLWSKFGPRLLANCRRRGFYISLTWLAPFFIVMLTVLFRGQDYAKDDLCWLPMNNNTRLSFLIPVSLILMIDITLYVLIIRARVKYDLQKGVSLSSICKHVGISSLSLFPALSLQWILGLSVTFDTSRFFIYLYVVLCSGQGMLILGFVVLTNENVKKALCAKISENGSEIESESGNQNTATDVLPMPEQNNRGTETS